MGAEGSQTRPDLASTAVHARSELNTATANLLGGQLLQGTWQRHSSKGYVELTGYATRLDTLLSARTP